MPPKPDALLLTCEHASNAVPAEHAELFAGSETLLASHRGWDPGALPVARRLAARFDVELIAGSWTRLLVEINRSPGPRAFSAITRALPATERARLLREVHQAHWNRVRAAARARLAEGRTLLHLGVHSFTPELDGEVRNVDVGVLYDPARPDERAWSTAFVDALKAAVPRLRVRRNHPYRGDSDGLTTVLRRELDTPRYLGIELEMNQALVTSEDAAAGLTTQIVAALRATTALAPSTS